MYKKVIQNDGKCIFEEKKYFFRIYLFNKKESKCFKTYKGNKKALRWKFKQQKIKYEYLNVI